MTAPRVDLDALVAFGEQAARAQLIGTRKQVPPTFIILTPAKGAEVFIAPWKSESEKDLAFHFVASLMKEQRAQAYAFVDEGWMSPIITAAEVLAVQEGRAQRASERPDRIEVVLAYATDGFNERSARWLIKRDELGTCVALERHKLAGGQEPMLAGRVTTLLTPRLQ